MRLRKLWLALREKLSPPLRIGIRTQLTALVCIVALVSLVILAITTGVYFTSNYKDLRSDRLLMAAQLKSSQVDQSLNFLFYQCYWLSSRDTLQTALANYVSGNKTYENWIDATNDIQKFLTSSSLFPVARVYDASFNSVLNSTNNETGDLLPQDILNELMPLSTNMPLPSSLQTEGLLTDPVLNDTTYVMSMSLPIYANPSIILSEARVYGYITVVMSADSIKDVYSTNSTSGLDKTNVVVVSAVYNSSEILSGYRFVFAPEGSSTSLLSEVFTIEDDSFLSRALREGDSGSLTHTSVFGSSYAVGYSPSDFDLVNWISIVLQLEDAFMEPSTKLTKIISGTVVAIGVFICIVTLPLTHWAVKPIVRLQAATELITEGRGLRGSTPGGSSISRSSSFIRRRPSRTSSLLSFTMNNEKDRNVDDRGRHSDNFAADGSITHDKAVRNSISGSLNDSNSSKSKKLTTSANLIEARVPVYRRVFSDELSELTDTFNTMTDALDQHYALLEDRVRARTRQLEAAKIEAEKANEAKTVFIANISHELRTPLNGILGMTAISMEERDIDKVQNSLKLIFRSGELLLHILTELLTFSKNVLQRTKLEKRDFNIIDVALQIKSIFGKVAKDQGVKLSITMLPNKIRKMILYGDSNRIIQIVMNLVSNALKFTPVDGKVDVRIRLQGEYDNAKSIEDNHKLVHIIEGTQPDDDIPDNLALKSQHEPSFSEKAADFTPSSNSDKTDSNESDTAMEKNDADDSSSLSSISTSSYDDTIFHSQFKKTTCPSEDGELLEVPKTWVISIEIEDTGPGIDPSLQESVFEPFVQGDQALSRQYGGTGLGLSICRQLARMMNGTMKLESSLGVGSKFTFTVPLSQTREITIHNDNPFEDEFNPHSKKNRKVKFKITKSLKSRKSKSSLTTSSTRASTEKHPELNRNPGSSSSLSNVALDRPFLQSTGTASSSKTQESPSTISKPYKILVAEDNHVNQEVIKRMLVLEHIGTIDLACDGQDAIDNVRALQQNGEHYDLIFMDVQMPRIDGLLATKMIRGDLDYKYPIVALTAFADESNIKVCLEAGMDGFLSKPIKRQKLKTIIDQYCEDKREEKEE